MNILVVSSNFPTKPSDVPSIFVSQEVASLLDKQVTAYAIRMPIKNFYASTVDNMVIKGGIEIHEASILFNTIAPVKVLLGLGYKNLFHPRDLANVTLYSSNIKKLAKKCRANLIHAHFAYIEGFSAVLAKENLNVPLIITLHGNDIVTVKSIGYGIRLQKRFNKIVQYTLEKADKVVVTSKFMRQQAIIAGCPPNKLVMIPHGVDINKFLSANAFVVRQRLGIGNRPVIFTARGHEIHYGLEYLIKAAAIVKIKRPDVVFLIGGKGSLTPVLKELASNLELGENLQFLGQIPHDDMPQYFKACTIFVLPSITESFGIVTIEAMACGKPVIGTNVGAIPEIIQNGRNGYIVNPRSPEEIAEKLLLLLNNEEKIQEMGKNNVIDSQEKYDIRLKAMRLRRLYDELIL